MKESSDNNKVEFLLDEGFFQALHRQLYQVLKAEQGSDSYVLIAMWLCKLKTALPSVKVDSTLLPATTLKEMLAAITKKGHKVKFVLWNGSNPVVEPVRTALWAAAKTVTLNLVSEPLGPGFLRFGGGSKVFADEVRIWGKSNPNVGVYLESYRPNFASFGTSNHQKVVICSVAGKLSALVGGFNLNEKYSAKPDHALEDQGWHDTAVLLQGPAAHIVQQEWLRRWNKQFYFSSETLPATREAQVPSRNKKSSSGWSSTVTIATTNGEASPPEKDIRALLIERIQAATRYIYLENYAFTDPQLIEALAAKMAQDRTVEVMVLIHHPQSPLYSTDTLWSYLQFYSFVELALARFKRIHIDRKTGPLLTLRHAMVQGGGGIKATACSLQKDWSKTEWGWRLKWSHAGVADSCKLTHIQSIEVPPFMYAPRTTTVVKGKPQWPYPHSKLALIDDKYAFVGSSNWTYRSMEYDGEITAMIEDEDVVADIRDQLFTHWQGGLTVGNFRDKALQNVKDVESKKMKANTCFIVPLGLEDFVRPDEATYKTKVGMDMGWTWF